MAIKAKVRIIKVVGDDKIDNLPVVSFSKWDLFGKPVKTKCKPEDELCRLTYTLRDVVKNKSLAVRCSRADGGNKVYEMLKEKEAAQEISEGSRLSQVQLILEKTDRSSIWVSLKIVQIHKCEYMDGDDFWFRVTSEDIVKHGV